MRRCAGAIEPVTEATLTGAPPGGRTVSRDPHAPASRPAVPPLARCVTELVELQAVYAAWLEALPDALRGTSTAEALQAIVDVDLATLALCRADGPFDRRIKTKFGPDVGKFLRVHIDPPSLGGIDPLT
jgi:hypothetical protein